MRFVDGWLIAGAALCVLGLAFTVPWPAWFGWAYVGLLDHVARRARRSGGPAASA
ncbi:hypothetical protein [Nocardioides sp.]|uniref:hypothetical protein n=1 Tax=Nocardioides sp. TaxID=35761 RepID=UPI003514A1CB